MANVKTNKIKKKKINTRSYNPKYAIPETKGNKNTSSISYIKKKTHINKNWIGSLIGFCDWGLKPHS
jgi:hypothetical protein